MAPLLPTITGPDPSDGTNPDVEPDISWKNELRKRIEDELLPDVEKARQQRDAQLAVHVMDPVAKDRIVQEHSNAMIGIRQLAQDKYMTALGRERRERQWLLKGELDQAFVREQQEILKQIQRKGSGRPQPGESLARGPNEDGSRGGERGELDQTHAPEQVEVFREIHRRGSGRPQAGEGVARDANEGGSFRGNNGEPTALRPSGSFRSRRRGPEFDTSGMGSTPQPWLDAGADLEDDPDSFIGTPGYDHSVSRRQSTSSLSKGRRIPEIWRPPANSDDQPTTSRTFAHASATVESPVSPGAPREGIPITRNRGPSMSNSIRSGHDGDLDVGSSSQRERAGIYTAEEQWNQLERARGKQGATSQRPEIRQRTSNSDFQSRRWDERSQAYFTPSPASSQFPPTPDGYRSNQLGVTPGTYRPDSEVMEIPIRSPSRMPPTPQGSPETTRYPQGGLSATRPIVNKQSDNDIRQPLPSPNSRWFPGSQGPPVNSTSGGRPTLPQRTPPFDESLRFPQSSPNSPGWHGPQSPPRTVRRDSSGSHSLRSQSSRQFHPRSDNYVSERQALQTYAEQSSVSSTDDDGSDSEDSGYDGDEALAKREAETRRQDAEAQRKRDEAARLEGEAKQKAEEARLRAEEAKRKEEEARRREEEARQKEAEWRRKEEEARQMAEEARQKEEEARQMAEDARQREEQARRMAEEVRRKEEEVQRKEEEAKKRDEEAKQKEQEMKLKEKEAKRKEKEAKRKEKEAERKELAMRLKEEEAKRREEEMRVKEEENRRYEGEIKRKEEELRRREEELDRREREAAKLQEEERVKAHEEQLRREQKAAQLREDEEARTRQQEELARREREFARMQEEQKLKDQQEVIRREREAAKRLEEEASAEREALLRREREVAKFQGEERVKAHQEQLRLEQEAARLKEIARVRQQEELARREQAAEEQRKLREQQERVEMEAAIRLQEEDKRKAQQDFIRRELEASRRMDEEKAREDFRRQQEELRRRAEERKRQDSMGSASESNRPAGSSYTAASPSSPMPIPSRNGSTTSGASTDRHSATSSSWGSTSGSMWSSSGRSTTSTYTQASTSGRTPVPPTAAANAAAANAKPAGGWKTSGTTPAAAFARTKSPTSPSLSRFTPDEEEEWTRRQDEQARIQQERFQRMQEQKEREIQARASKVMTKEDVVRLFEDHERRWAKLPEITSLSWYMFPWPVLKRPEDPEELTTVAISAYVLSPHSPGDKSRSPKDRIKEHIRRWHPDRFETKLLPKVREEDREKVQHGAGVVARNLNELLTRSANTIDMFS